MEELIIFMVKNLVSKPEAVSVSNDGLVDDSIVYNLIVADEDKGFVIGKQGRVAKALRLITRAAAAKEGKRININII